LATASIHASTHCHATAPSHTCPKDWIQFQESCYFFNNSKPPWKTWDQSRQFCQNMKSDLVVISSLEEQVFVNVYISQLHLQNFIKNKIQYYYDTHHGYWIGLQKVNNNWTWVDGSPDTLGPHCTREQGGLLFCHLHFGQKSQSSVVLLSTNFMIFYHFNATYLF
uniref:C-type lectin domain-containing protein n=1 Tax=Oryzias sinensis TaxID=183150 RepID=A0A8C7X4E9_9TELE